MGLNAKQERTVLSNLNSWKQSLKPEGMAMPLKRSVEIIRILGSIINIYGYGQEEIEVLLREAFLHFALTAKDHGWEEGRDFERRTNPAIRSAGACVKIARDEERKALRNTLRAVFDAECERGTNPLYAFNEALKAIE